MERADFKESGGEPAVVIRVADIVGVAAQSETGRAGVFRHSLADGGHRRGNDGQGQDSHDQYCDYLRFHSCYTTACHEAREPLEAILYQRSR